MLIDTQLNNEGGPSTHFQGSVFLYTCLLSIFLPCTLQTFWFHHSTNSKLSQASKLIECSETILGVSVHTLRLALCSQLSDYRAQFISFLFCFLRDFRLVKFNLGWNIALWNRVCMACRRLWGESSVILHLMSNVFSDINLYIMLNFSVVYFDRINVVLICLSLVEADVLNVCWLEVF